MKRILVLLSVVAMMVVMLAASVAPAFAASAQWRCYMPGVDNAVFFVAFGNQKHLAKQAGYTDCVKV
jgi:hypothetical protein